MAADNVVSADNMYDAPPGPTPVGPVAGRPECRRYAVT